MKKHFLNFLPGITRITSNIIPLVILFFMSKLIPVAELGLLSYFSSIITIVGVVTDFGLPETIQRIINTKNAKNKLGAIIYFEFILVLFVTICFVLLDGFLDGYLSKGYAVVFFIFVFSSSNVVIIAFNAIEKYSRASIYYFVSSILFLVLTFVLFYTGTSGVSSFLYARLISWVFVTFIALWDIKKFTNLTPSLALDSRVLKFTFGAFLITASYVVLNNWDSIIVNNIFGGDINGYYRSALILGSVPLILTTLVSTRYLPQLSKLWDANKKNDIKKTLIRLCMVLSGLFVVGLVLLMFIGKPAMQIFYNQYIADNGFVYLLIGYISSCIYVIGAVLAIYMYVSHKVWTLTLISVLIAVIFVVASTWGALTFGLVFVPICLLIANLLFTICVAVRVIFD